MNRRQFLGGVALALAGGVGLAVTHRSGWGLSTVFGEVGGIYGSVVGYRRPVSEERVFVPDVTDVDAPAYAVLLATAQDAICHLDPTRNERAGTYWTNVDDVDFGNEFVVGFEVELAPEEAVDLVYPSPTTEATTRDGLRRMRLDLVGETRTEPLPPDLASAETVVLTALFLLDSPSWLNPIEVTVVLDDRSGGRTITASSTDNPPHPFPHCR